MYAVLEVGGTHVTAALVDPGDLRILRSQRTDINSSASAELLMAAFVEAVQKLEARAARLVVAIPGPFDYERGVGDFEGVAKFGSLRGVPLGAELADRLGVPVQFVNDVTAYGLGQYHLLGQPRRLVTITLGTGVGSAFLDDGVAVVAGPLVPPDGWVYLLEHDGRPIEETFSRRAIIRAYGKASGHRLDVAEIASLALDGDPQATEVLKHAYQALADTLAPWLIGFRTHALVLGGSISRSWELVERWFVPRLEECFSRYRARPARVVQGRGHEEAALIGAALHARRTRQA